MRRARERERERRGKGEGKERERRGKGEGKESERDDGGGGPGGMPSEKQESHTVMLVVVMWGEQRHDSALIELKRSKDFRVHPTCITLAPRKA